MNKLPLPVRMLNLGGGTLCGIGIETIRLEGFAKLTPRS